MNESPEPVSQQERLNLLLDLVMEGGRLTSSDIVKRFGVSAATARRDLNMLTEQRLVTRTHGGAVASGSAYELPLQYKIARNATGKLAIAEVAASLVTRGSVVGLTGGTTTSEVARAIGRSHELNAESSQPNVTIVTNALNIAYEMAIRPHVKIVVTGGAARRQTFELVGPLVSESLQGLHLDWTFVGVNGLHDVSGATTADEGEAQVNRLLARVANKVAIVADATKMNHVAFARICSFDEIDVLVTDLEPPAEIVAVAQRNQVEILRAR